ncbi:MAG: hypothetical protein JXD23_06430 [Spirochaetales bacterium]|nr:hypothetical protein [Spirochaetales bacterium]
MAFGIAMGFVFPLYAALFVEFKSEFHGTFFVAGRILAGIMVGGVSFVITRLTIISVIRLLPRELGAARGSRSAKFSWRCA